MTIQEKVLEVILRQPGVSKTGLSRMFDLSAYRLHRVFRQIERDLFDCILVHHHENGVWVVKVDPKTCLGMKWCGTGNKGYRQCERLPDNRTVGVMSTRNGKILKWWHSNASWISW